MKQGKYYWHNKKVSTMFILARIFGRTCTGYDYSHDSARILCCKVIMKYFCGKYYVIKEEWL